MATGARRGSPTEKVYPARPSNFNVPTKPTVAPMPRLKGGIGLRPDQRPPLPQPIRGIVEGGKEFGRQVNVATERVREGVRKIKRSVAR